MKAFKRLAAALFLTLIVLSCQAQREKPVYGHLHVYGRTTLDSILKIPYLASTDTGILISGSDGTIDTVGIQLFRAWLGTGSGVAGVTAVGMALPSQFNVTGSPVTGSGTLTGTWRDTTAGVVFAGPTTGTGKPQFRALVSTDIPDISGNYIQNQTAADQTAGFRISGNGLIGGKLGLNRTSPNAKIHGYFNKTSDTLFILRNSVTGNDTGIWVLSNGYMGLGTNAPTAPFHCTGNIKTNLNLVLGNNGASIGDTYAEFVTNAAANIKNISLGVNSALSFWTKNVERVRIDPDGNVGIGTTTPVYKFDVAGDINISIANTLRLGAYAALGYGGVVTGGYALELGGNSSWKALIYDKGNFGLGTRTPAEILDVNGRVKLAQGTAPVTTTDKLYNVGGNLYWNAMEISPQSKGANLIYASPNGSAGMPTWRKIYEDDIVLGSGTIFVGFTGSVAKARSLSGDATLSNLGALTIADNAVDGTDISLSGEQTDDLMKFNGTDWVHYADSNYCSTAGDVIYGNLTSTGQVSAGGTYALNDTIPVINLRSGVLTLGSGDTTDANSIEISTGPGASVSITGTDPGEVKVNAGVAYLSVKESETKVTNNLTVDGTFSANVYAQSNKIYQQNTEPDIPTGSWAFWRDLDDGKTYIVVDLAGTQYKSEML